MRDRLWPGKPSKLVMWIAAIVVILGAVTAQLVNVGLGHAAGVSGWESPLWPNNNTYPNVISDCNGDGGNVKPDVCTFHVTGHHTTNEPAKRVSPVLSQCKQTTASTLTINWSDTESTSFEQSTTSGFTAKADSDLGNGVTAGISASYDTTWSWSTEQSVTSGGSIAVPTPANHDAWVTFAAQDDVYTGWLEVHYPSQVYGHYYWYYPSQNATTFTVASPKLSPNGSGQLGNITGVTQLCGHHK